MGGTFKAGAEQASEFVKKMEGALFEKMENGRPNPFKLQKISNAASQYCKEVIKEARAEERKMDREPKQELKRGMKR
jgi:hypothetical protein